MKVMRLEKCTSKTPQMAACSKMHEIIIHDILKKGRNLISRALSAESWGRGVMTCGPFTQALTIFLPPKSCWWEGGGELFSHILSKSDIGV